MVPLKYRGNPDSSKLALMFPGRGYNPHMPLLYYTTRFLVYMGWQVWEVWYDYSRQSESIPSDLTKDVREALALSKGRFSQGLLIGKSLGTVALSLAYETRGFERVPGLWLTPVMSNPKVRACLLQPSAPGLVVYGDQDPAADLSLKGAIQRHLQLVEFEGADHSLEKNDMLGNLVVMQRYMEYLKRFLNQLERSGKPK